MLLNLIFTNNKKGNIISSFITYLGLLYIFNLFIFFKKGTLLNIKLLFK